MDDPRARAVGKLKQAAKRALRPVASRVIARVDARVASYIAESPEMESVRTLLPMVLGNVSSQNAALREARRGEIYLRKQGDLLATRLDALETSAAQMAERNEFVRRELLYELRYRAPEVSVTASQSLAPEILDEGKLAAAKGAIRLNLGCGHLPLEGYLNVDARAVDGVDILADVRKLPFDPSSVAEIFSSHVLEHFPQEELSRVLLPYWFSLLAPGGEFRAVAPDGEAMIAEYEAGRVPLDELRRVLYGDQEYDGDFHYTMFTPSSLTKLLERAGFVDVDVVASARRNGISYEMELRARRPSDEVESTDDAPSG